MPMYRPLRRQIQRPRTYQPQSQAQIHPNNHMLSPLAAGVIAPFSPSVAGKVTAADPTGVPTLKVAARAIGTITCNAAGRGQALIIPTTANNVPALQVTGSTWFNGTDNFDRPAIAAGAGITDLRHNGPYSTTQLLSQASDNGVVGGNAFRYESRINLIGVRITPTGPVLNRSGTVYIVRPAHATDISYFTSAIYVAEANTHSVAVSEMPYNYEYAFGPFNMDDTEMSSDIYNWVSDSTSRYWDSVTTTAAVAGVSITPEETSGRAAVCGIAIVGCQANFTFRVEVIYHMEFSGDPVASLTTPVTPDFAGTVNALSLASDIDKSQKADPTVHRSTVAESAHIARAAAGPLSVAAQAGVPGASVALSVDHLIGSKQGSSAIGKAATVATAASKMMKLKLQSPKFCHFAFVHL